MELLEAINIVLPTLGEHQVTRVDIKHPTLAIVLPILYNNTKRSLLRGWWFNTSMITLYPDSEGGIGLPLNTLAFLSSEDQPSTVRDGKLYNMSTHDFLWSEPVKGELRELLEFDQLPESCAMYLLYQSLVQAYLTDIGLESVVSEWKQLAKESEFLVAQEHLRNRRHSTMKSSRYGRLRSAMRA